MLLTKAVIRVFKFQLTQANEKIFCQKEKDIESFWSKIGGAESKNALSFGDIFTFIFCKNWGFVSQINFSYSK